MNVYTKEEYLLLANMIEETFSTIIGTKIGYTPLVNTIREYHIEDLPEKIKFYSKLINKPICDATYKPIYDAIYNFSIEKIILLLNDKNSTIRIIAAWRVLIGR